MILLGVFGNPIEHSRSPEIHADFARQHDLDIEYRKVLVPEGEFAAAARSFLSEGATGFNITLPFKNAAYDFVDEVSKNAKAAQSVNTIWKTPSGRLVGHNTDGPGLVADLRQNLLWPIKNKRVLVIGAGGAVQGVVLSLLNEQPAYLHIYNRTKEKAEKIVERIKSIDSKLDIKAISSSELESCYDLIISGSSAGLSQDVNANANDIALPTCIVGANSYCYDMIYSDQQTSFLSWCESQQCQQSSDGLGMLIEQAARAFTLWLGHDVITAPVMKQLRPPPGGG